MGSRFVNNCRGKTSIMSIMTFAKREQYSQKLRNIYVTISDAHMRGFLPLLNGLLDAANLLKYVQHVRIYFCA
jgi:hypothetical protein